MHLPRGVDSQVQEEGSLRGVPQGDRRDPAGVGGPHGRRGDRGGQRLQGPHTHMPADTAEVRGQQGGRQAEGSQRDNAARAAP